MSEQERTGGTEQLEPAAAAFADDAFADVRALIALITDPKGCGVRLQSLQERQAAALAAEAKLAAERADFAAEIKKRGAEIEARHEDYRVKKSSILIFIFSKCEPGDKVGHLDHPGCPRIDK